MPALSSCHLTPALRALSKPWDTELWVCTFFLSVIYDINAYVLKSITHLRNKGKLVISPELGEGERDMTVYLLNKDPSERITSCQNTQMSFIFLSVSACGRGGERKESVLALLLHCWIKTVTYPSSTSKSLLIFSHNWHFTAFCCPSCLNINASKGSDDCSHPEQRIRN